MPLPTRKERRAAGKALRDHCARESHAGWKAPKGRCDPIDLLLESSEGRIPQLVPIRYGRMKQSPFAFYRGAAAIMAADLARTPTTGIRVQACGDCHLLNFGGFGTPERNIIFDNLRHQRFRRDAAGAVGMGCEAPGGEPRRRRSAQRLR
jgi:hypothetical protein